jgi:predicted house-cleaning noncanonical NTP pyrophosphatase (MazG superfamily)
MVAIGPGEELGDSMRIEYGKLVRDGIPDIIRSSGRACGTEVMSAEEYRRALLLKLVEEAQEASSIFDATHLAAELADLQEVMDAVLETFNIGRETVAALQATKRQQRGGFGGRIRLLWTE